jgi:hypothetical protein
VILVQRAASSFSPSTTATMERVAVLSRGALRVLITEPTAWSSDPGTGRHAGLAPFHADVLCRAEAAQTTTAAFCFVAVG